MTRISFPICSKCSCCPSLLAVKDATKTGDVIILCTLKGKCPVNIERNVAVFGIETYHDEPPKKRSPFIKKL